MKKISLSLGLIVFMLLTAGCWDRRELNDRALLLGWGMDIQKDGSYKATAQMAISSKIGTGQDSIGQDFPYFVESGIGTNIRGAADDMQLKISRSLFAGHRRAIVIGESLAQHGLKDIIDEYSRYIIVRLRTNMFVVKGGTATDFLSQNYPYERLPIFGAAKIQEAYGLRPESMLRDFLLEASNEGHTPILPMIEVVSPTFSTLMPKGEQERIPRIKLAGFAIFDSDLKMMGMLDIKDASMREWIHGKLRKSMSLSVVVPELGNVSLDTTRLKSEIVPVIQNNKVTKVNITLTGRSSLIENNTRLDLSSSKNLLRIQEAINKQLEINALKVIRKIQGSYGTDIFGINESIHRKYPYVWKTLKKQWNKEFAETEIAVKVKLSIRETGQIGKPLHLKKNEVQ